MNNELMVFATNNKNKLREARQILAPLGITLLSLQEAGVYSLPEETGNTFADNAMIKARAVYDTAKMPVIADDSGLCVDALEGRPGVFSARYAPVGKECAKLLEEMKDIPEDKRSASFKCVIAYIDHNRLFTVVGTCQGTIGYEEKGTNGFGYDPVFMCNGKSMAEMTAEEKNELSHRGKALRALFSALKG